MFKRTLLVLLTVFVFISMDQGSSEAFECKDAIDCVNIAPGDPIKNHGKRVQCQNSSLLSKGLENIFDFIPI